MSVELDSSISEFFSIYVKDPHMKIIVTPTKDISETKEHP